EKREGGEWHLHQRCGSRRPPLRSSFPRKREALHNGECRSSSALDAGCGNVKRLDSRLRGNDDGVAPRCLIPSVPISHCSWVTRSTSSSVVTPATALARPSSYMLRMPCARACCSM